MYEFKSPNRWSARRVLLKIIPKHWHAGRNTIITIILSSVSKDWKFLDLFIRETIQEIVSVVQFGGHKGMNQLCFGSLIERLTDIPNVLEGKGTRLTLVKDLTIELFEGSRTHNLFCLF